MEIDSMAPVWEIAFHDLPDLILCPSINVIGDLTVSDPAALHLVVEYGCGFVVLTQTKSYSKA